MAYCTYQNLANMMTAVRLSQLTVEASVSDETSEASALAAVAAADPQAIITEAISQSDALIDIAVGTRYAVPLTGTIPAFIRGLSCRGAMLWLQRNRGRGVWTENDQKEADSLADLLEEIRLGKIPVPGLTQTKGLAEVVGSMNPFDSRPNTDGTNDPDTVNAALTDPLADY